MFMLGGAFTTVVVPFVQALVGKSAEDAYERIRAALTRSKGKPQAAHVSVVDLGMRYDVGWFYWDRALSADGDDRAVALTFAAFAPLCDAQPAAVPEGVLHSLPVAEQPGAPRVPLWIELVGPLVRDPQCGDTTARTIANTSARYARRLLWNTSQRQP